MSMFQLSSDIERQQMKKIVVDSLFKKEEDDEMEGGFEKM